MQGERPAIEQKSSWAKVFHKDSLSRNTVTYEPIKQSDKRRQTVSFTRPKKLIISESKSYCTTSEKYC